MGVFDSVERKLEDAVSGVFARAFKGDVQPVEITARLERELDAEAQLLGRDRKLVPNSFQVFLSPHDFARIDPYSQTLNSEIIPQLTRYASEHGYIFNGAVTIRYQEDAKLPIGRFKVASKAVADVAASPDLAVSGSAAPGFATPSSDESYVDESYVESYTEVLAVDVNGTRYQLTPPGLTIGRGVEADLRINDPGISRQHAQILVNGFGQSLTLAVEDLGSTNGITVDGQQVTSAPLALGSRIGIGSTVLTIVSVVSDV